MDAQKPISMDMNFQNYFNLYMESAIAVREFNHIPNILKIKYNNFKNKLLRVLQLKEKLQEDDRYADMEYYLRQTNEEEIIRVINKILGNHKTMWDDSLLTDIHDLEKINKAALDPKNNWRMSDLLKVTTQTIQRMINNISDWGGLFFDERYRERKQDSDQQLQKLIDDENYGWEQNEKHYFLLLQTVEPLVRTFKTEM